MHYGRLLSIAFTGATLHAELTFPAGPAARCTGLMKIERSPYVPERVYSSGCKQGVRREHPLLMPDYLQMSIALVLIFGDARRGLASLSELRHMEFHDHAIWVGGNSARQSRRGSCFECPAHTVRGMSICTIWAAQESQSRRMSGVSISSQPSGGPTSRQLANNPRRSANSMKRGMARNSLNCGYHRLSMKDCTAE